MKSKFPLSYVVLCRCRNFLRTYWADFFQISVVTFPGPYAWLQILLEVLKSFQFFRSFFFREQNLQTNTPPSNHFFLNFFKQSTLCVLEFWVYDSSGILFVFFVFQFVNMGPYRRKKFKTLLLPQVTFEFCQTSPEFSPPWSLQKYSVGFLKCWVCNFRRFVFVCFVLFFVFVNMGPYLSKIFKSY